MISQEDIKELIRKYNAGTASPQERKKLEHWYHREINARRLEDKDADFLLLKEELWNQVTRRSGWVPEPKERAIKQRNPGRLLWIGAAAAIAMIVSIGVWMSSDSRIHSIEREDTQSLSVQEDILPGGNRATLILSDGRKLDLNENESGIVMHNGGSVTYADGKDILQLPPGGKDGQLASPQYTTLQTPKGGTYQIRLPDGTKVWLNAASSLKYPSYFPEGQTRVVELQGEAFFEVKPAFTSASASGSMKRIPFLVQTQSQTVEVLGTTFNISAYPDEPNAITTLLEGKVRISAESPRRAKILSPGQQAVMSVSDIEVHAVNTEPFVSWKSGTFVFENTPLEDAMRQIMRWYDIEIDLQALPAREITGIVSRQEKLSAFLQALSISSGLDFTLEGRRLVLKKE